MEKNLFILVGALALFSNVSAFTYCKTNSECEHLGDLKCIKSACEWGMCSCPRGYISRYLGSEMRYRCVPQSKIGEPCTSNGLEGVCGAISSHCQLNISRCACDKGKVSRFNGEMCLDENDIFPGEEVSGDQSSCQQGQSFSESSFKPNTIVDYNPMSCLCPQGKKLVLYNWFSDNVHQGKKFPRCLSIKVGDTCIQDEDCANIGGTTNTGKAKCVNNKCACKVTDSVAKFGGLICGTSLGYGQNCTGFDVRDKVCDGSKGLTCGQDTCYPNDDIATRLDTCVCHYTTIKSGTTCKARILGDECFGDRNCHGINVNAQCVDGFCRDSSTMTLVSMSMLLACLLTHLLK